MSYTRETFALRIQESQKRIIDINRRRDSDVLREQRLIAALEEAMDCYTKDVERFSIALRHIDQAEYGPLARSPILEPTT